MKLPLWRVAEFTGAGGDFDGEAVAAGYSIDSRTLSPGDLFLAVAGERLDGHDFVAQAMERGAVAAIVSKARLESFSQRRNLLAVDDTLAALQALGAAVRRVWGKCLIGITGSAGKTTTKEAVAHLLAQRCRVLKSEGNLNNHFGLPLQLLRLEAGHDVAVIEMGMSHAGEITALATLAAPGIGVVTNVAPAHLGFFDSVAAIARAKYELIASLPAKGIAVLNADDPYVCQFGRDFHGKVVLYGIEKPAAVRAENIVARGTEGSSFDLVVAGCREPVTLALIGVHNIYNVLAAVAVALQRGLSPSEAAAALATLRPGERRGEILQIAGAAVLNDCYNSNPKALKAMVDALATVPARRRIVVAGEMLELGVTGADLHRECGTHMAGRVDALLGVRGLAGYIVEAAGAAGVKAEFVETPEQAAAWLAKEVQPGDAVLLKASRGVRLERALELWKAGSGGN